MLNKRRLEEFLEDTPEIFFSKLTDDQGVPVKTLCNAETHDVLSGSKMVIFLENRPQSPTQRESISVCFVRWG